MYLVLSWESGAVPKRLADALKEGGGAVVDTSPGRNVKAFVTEHIERSGLKLDAGAVPPEVMGDFCLMFCAPASIVSRADVPVALIRIVTRAR